MDTVVFCPAPGWPAPPTGWMPQAGWQPDPSWPLAPPGWVFYRTTEGVPAPVPAGGWVPPIVAPNPYATPIDPYAVAPAAPQPVAPTPPFNSAPPYAAAPSYAAAPPYATAQTVPPTDPYAAAAATGLPPMGANPAGMYAVPPSMQAPKKRRSPLTLVITIVVIFAVVFGGIGIFQWTQRYTTPLTQAEFLNLINEQLPGGTIPQPQFQAYVSMKDILDCPEYEALDSSVLLSGATFNDALGGQGLFLANFQKRSDAEAAGNATYGCDTSAGYSPTQTTTNSKGVQTWTLQEVDPSDSSDHVTNVAVYHNILAYAYDADQSQWQTFVTTTFPAGVDAARKAA